MKMEHFDSSADQSNFARFASIQPRTSLYAFWLSSFGNKLSDANFSVTAFYDHARSVVCLVQIVSNVSNY